MNIAILGTGPVAQTLSGALAGRGHTVTLGSRDPDGVDDAVVPVAGHAAAIEPADLVINAIAGSQALDAITAIGADVLAGKVLLDLGNAVTPAFELAFPNAGLGESLQEALPDTAVVKSLNTLAAPLMVQPDLVPSSTVFVSGDDDASKDVVRGVLADLGWGAESVIDLGGIASARGPEHYFLLFAGLWQALGTPMFNAGVVRAL